MLINKLIFVVVLTIFYSRIATAIDIIEPKCISPLDTHNLKSSIKSQTLTDFHENSKCEYTISRQRIIPYSILREFFNKALSRLAQYEISSKLTEFAKLLVKDFIQYERATWSSSDEMRILREILNGKFRLPKRPLHLADLEGSSTMNLTLIAQTIFIWMPFNSFEGPHPQNRVGSTIENFEMSGATIVGKENMNLLEMAYKHMLNYIDLSDQSIGYFRKAIDNLIDLRNRNPFGYSAHNSNEWKLVSARPSESGSNQCIFLMHGNSVAKTRTQRPNTKDIYCVNSHEQVMIQFENSHKQFEKGSSGSHLETTKQIAKSVTRYGKSVHYPSWIDAYKIDPDDMMGKSSNEALLVFNDQSVAVIFQDPNRIRTDNESNLITDSWKIGTIRMKKNSRYGLLLFDNRGRPVAVLIYPDHQVYAFQDGRWRWRDYWNWEGIFVNPRSGDAKSPSLLRYRR